jgi:ABC-type multidrug transport system fused ATPase/permease subunit
LKREKELKLMWNKNFWTSTIIASLYFFPQVLSSVVFATYIGTGHYIDLGTAFSVLVFFELIKDPMRSLPYFISSFIELLVSMRRIQAFIDSDELQLDKMILNSKMENAIEILGHSFSWGVKNEEKKDEAKKSKDKDDGVKKGKEEEKLLDEDASIALDQSQRDPLIQKSGDDKKKKTLDSIITLKNIDISIKKGELVCVIGDVGSGKSSLL